MKRTLFLLILLILSFGNAWAERFTVTNDNNEKIIVDGSKPQKKLTLITIIRL